MPRVAMIVVRSLPALATAALVSIGATASALTLSLSPIVSISGPSEGNPEQVWARADPGDPRYLMVCGNLRDGRDNLLAGYVYSSADGGTRWSRTLLENSTRFVSEESCTYGSTGNAYFIAGASNYYGGNPHHETGHMHLFRSVDHGSTWRRIWTRRDGWLDWTSLAETTDEMQRRVLVLFANAGTDRLGHWFPSRPVAVESIDDGRSFTSLIVPHPWGFRYVTAWVGDSVTLRDGTVLFATSAARGPANGKYKGWANGLVGVEIFAYDPTSHSLRTRAVLRSLWKVPVFTAALALGRGHFDGRLYAAWVESDAHKSALWFATSNDGGHTWRSRPFLRGAGEDTLLGCSAVGPIDQVSLASAPDGSVGILWRENNSTLLFSASKNGGRTFGHPLVVASTSELAYVPDEVNTWDDYWLKAVLDLWAKKRNPQTAWLNTPGLGVVMLPTDIWDQSLVADSSSRFHMFWISPYQQSYRVLTRIVVVQDYAEAEPERSTPDLRHCSNNLASRAALPALPRQIPKLKIPNNEDVTASIRLDPLEYRYDQRTKLVTVNVELVNLRKRTLHAPLTILGIYPHSDFGTASAVNASGILSGNPYWNVSAAIPAMGLAQGAHSRRFQIVVRISEFRVLPSRYLSGDAFSFAVRVFEGVQGRS